MAGGREGFPALDDITFLDRNGIRITCNWFAVPGRRYSISELTEIWTIAGPRNPLARNAFVATGLVTVVAAISSPYLNTVAAWVGVVAILAMPLTIALVALRMKPRPQALWGRYRGRSEKLFESGDPTWFFQVCRALNRARELHS